MMNLSPGRDSVKSCLGAWYLPTTSQICLDMNNFDYLCLKASAWSSLMYKLVCGAIHMQQGLLLDGHKSPSVKRPPFQLNVMRLKPAESSATMQCMRHTEPSLCLQGLLQCFWSSWSSTVACTLEHDAQFWQVLHLMAR